MDLERVLPTGVQVTSIEPILTTEGEVNIRLRVSGDRERAVDLIRNLEKSQRFLQPRLANESAQTQEQGHAAPVAPGAAPGAVEFDILSGYNPLPTPDRTKDKERPAQDEVTDGKPAKPSESKTKNSKPAQGKPAAKKATTGGAR